MKPVPLSRMEARVEVQERTVTQDVYGAAVPAWATVAVRWGKVEPLSGREQWQAQQVRPDVTHRVTLRYYSALTARHRLKIGERIFNIESVVNVENRRRQHDCICVEEVT